MAQLQIETDPLVPGRWTLRSSNGSALAAVPDALVQVLELGGETMAAWALHNDEQQGMREHAYEDERRELGQLAHVEIVELTRPWQPNVVWVDRYHLVVASGQASSASRLLGLYVGSQGDLVMSVHHPSVAAQVHGAMRTLATGADGSGGARPTWDDPTLVSMVRFLLRSHQQEPGVLQVRAPQPMAMAVQEGLTRLSQMVAGW